MYDFGTTVDTSRRAIARTNCVVSRLYAVVVVSGMRRSFDMNRAMDALLSCSVRSVDFIDQIIAFVVPFNVDWFRLVFVTKNMVS